MVAGDQIMSIHKHEGKRGNSYQVKYRDTSGKQLSKTFRNKKQAVFFQAMQFREKDKQQLGSFADYPTYNAMLRMHRSESEKKFKHAALITPRERPKPAYLQWDRNHERLSEDAPLLEDSEGFHALLDWQEGRCAMCGFDNEQLVKDHCHESGLIRGLLCTGCNLDEARMNSLRWQIYRKFPPTMFVNVKVFYNDQSSFWKQSDFSKEEINTPWWESDKELSHTVLEQFCRYQISLDWMDKNQFRKLIETAMKSAKEGL